MYLQTLELKSAGPIEFLNLQCRFNSDGSPNPIVLVGKNGSGKSVAIAHIVSALIAAHGTLFDDTDVEKGKVYKVRSPSYITRGSSYSTGGVHFTEDFSTFEATLAKQKNAFDEPYPDYAKWNEILPNQNTHYSSNFEARREELRSVLQSGTHLFFPANRFEEPAWLNELNLINKASYTSLKNFTGYSNRPIINYAPMRDLQNWLLDLIYDSFALERKSIVLPASFDAPGEQPQVVEYFTGEATSILGPIGEFLKVLFDMKGQVKWSVGARNRRQIGITIGEHTIASNLFQLSTGQAVLLDLFFSIIKDFDLGQSRLEKLSDIHGIVVVDEIDLHLHTELQHDLLPKLINLFPRVQFIMTTHSPLFVVGMEKVYSSEGFQLVELPTGVEIEAERFSEFEVAYKYMQESTRFETEVRKRLDEGKKPIVYCEGSTDIDYLLKAANLLGRSDLVEKFEFADGIGSANLGKMWDTYKGHLGYTLNQKVLLLFDCDADKPASESGKLRRRTIPRLSHKIDRGIENLFSDATIGKATAHNSAFIDIVGERTDRSRGLPVTVPDQWSINRDEKRNLCDWLCATGDKDDFAHFSEVFSILEEMLAWDCQGSIVV